MYLLYIIAVSYDILGTATAPVPACSQATRGGMFWLRREMPHVMQTDCLDDHDQRVAWPHPLAGGDQPGSQAHKLDETLRVHNTKQDDKHAVFHRSNT